MTTQTTVRKLYRWRGVSHSGQARSGKATLKPETMAALIERYWRAGWPDLLVVTGDGPLPPRRDDPNPVGGITKNEGRRVWWAET